MPDANESPSNPKVDPGSDPTVSLGVGITAAIVALMLVFFLFGALAYHFARRLFEKKGWFEGTKKDNDGPINEEVPKIKQEDELSKDIMNKPTAKEDEERVAGGNSAEPLEVIIPRTSLQTIANLASSWSEKDATTKPPLPTAQQIDALTRQSGDTNFNRARIPLNARPVAKIGVIIAMDKLQEHSRQTSIQRSEPTQMSSRDWSSSCPAERQLKESLVTAISSTSKGENNTKDSGVMDGLPSELTLNGVTSLRKSEGIWATSRQPVTFSPVMQPTQRETESIKASSKRATQRGEQQKESYTSSKARRTQENYESTKSTKIAPPKSIPMLPTVDRIAAGIDQELRSVANIDETPRERWNSDLSRQQVPPNLVVGQNKELFYESSFEVPAHSLANRSTRFDEMSSSTNDSMSSEQEELEEEDSQPFSLHESDLEVPRFGHIKDVLGANHSLSTRKATPLATPINNYNNKSPVSWALTPPSEMLFYRDLSPQSRDVSRFSQSTIDQ